MMFEWIGASSPEPVLGLSGMHGVGQTGLIGDVRVASTAGWRAARTIGVGDKVLTFDGGLQPVVAVQSMPLWDGQGTCPASLWPVEVPAGAMGNRDRMYLAADQAVLVESDAAEEMTGEPFALIPARSLDGVRGMCRVPPPADAEVTILQFETEQIVFANSGAMFHCPPATADLVSADPTAKGYHVLDMTHARIIADSLENYAASA